MKRATMLKHLSLSCILLCMTMTMARPTFLEKEIPSANYLVCNIKGSSLLLVDLPHCMARLNIWSCRKKDDLSTFLLQEVSKSIHNLDLLTSRAVMLRVDKNATLCTCKGNTEKTSFEKRTLHGMDVYSSASQGVSLQNLHTGHLQEILNDIEKEGKKRAKVNYTFAEMTNHHPDIVKVMVVKSLSGEHQNAVQSQYPSSSP